MACSESEPLPLELARALEPLGGLVFLDSAQSAGQSYSIVAVQPQRLLEGSMEEDWPRVEDRLKSGGPGALIGYVGYNGAFCFGHYEQLYRYDHRRGLWLDALPPVQVLERSDAPQLHFVPQVSRTDYLHAVQRAKDFIAAGDIYQVNLTYPWSALWPTAGSAFALYERLREVSPAPFASYMDLGGKRVLSSSPESFLRMQGRQITTRPIKGTRPRATVPEQDMLLAQELLHSVKEKAELLMITDLLRNDLGQVCDYGTVQVPEVWRLESYAQVHHLVSTVTGLLREGKSHASALRACFPGGSITGAPKHRAMQIITELEQHPRGLYTGCLGYFGLGDEAASEFSICIRTLCIRGQKATFNVGSGIVADSEPQSEYEETLHKAQGLLRACALT